MVIKRREFLQKSGWLLAGLGISEALLWQLSDRYAQTLAQPTKRKLALLVGINQYPNLETESTPLRGAITDVELQRELLTYRFGFQPSDILTLIDSEATRENIEMAFQSHLKEQAKAGDIVIFHFSGFGSRISLDESLERVQNSLVPVDDILPIQSGSIAKDLLEETLLILLRSLSTENAIAFLDASYTDCGADFQGNLRIRYRSRPTVKQVSPAELAFLTGLKANSGNLDLTQFSSKIRVISPAKIAAEIEHNGFNAGVFTYALTQSLWQTTDAVNLQINLSQAVNTISKLTERDRLLEIPAKNSQIQDFPINVSDLIANSPSADGAAIAIEDSGKTLQLWMGGLPAKILDAYQVNSVFTLLPETIPRWQLRSRNGLIAKAQIRELPITDSKFITPVVGQLVREAVRVLPRNINLTVALDPGLERIERVDATSAFALIPQVSVVTGEQVADYRFGRVSKTAIAQMPNTSLPPLYQGRYGLFSVGQKLIPNTVGDGGAAVKVAVQSLAPQMKTLLAAKLLELTTNVESSLLKVSATLAVIPPTNNVNVRPKILIEQIPPRAFEQGKTIISPDFQQNPDGIVNLSVGSRIQYSLYNRSDRPVYFMVFCLDSNGLAIVFNPPSPPTTTDNDPPDLLSQFAIAPVQALNQSVDPNQTTTPKNTLEWLIHGPSGLVETHILFSHSPFTQTLTALAGEMQQVRDNLSIAILLNPLKVAQAVLQDLHNASMNGVEKVGLVTEDFALDVNAWANLSFVYRVI
ncbi:peptidase C14 [Oscillatoriales cyanobacterium USR001]|nr:peptidase C14 [Oscillatoriales cyanobacterium USR001]